MREKALQTLFHAGDELPSKNLKRYGRVYVFSNLRFAQGWAKKHHYSHVYQFTTSKYTLDSNAYIRATPNGKELSDNEYICTDVVSEKMIESLSIN
jgi:hypothetical protein